MPNEKAYTLFVLYHILLTFCLFQAETVWYNKKKYENKDMKIRSAKGETGLANH